MPPVYFHVTYSFHVIIQGIKLVDIMETQGVFILHVFSGGCWEPRSQCTRKGVGVVLIGWQKKSRKIFLRGNKSHLREMKRYYLANASGSLDA